MEATWWKRCWPLGLLVGMDFMFSNLWKPWILCCSSDMIPFYVVVHNGQKCVQQVMVAQLIVAYAAVRNLTTCCSSGDTMNWPSWSSRTIVVRGARHSTTSSWSFHCNRWWQQQHSARVKGSTILKLWWEFIVCRIGKFKTKSWADTLVSRNPTDVLILTCLCFVFRIFDVMIWRRRDVIDLRMLLEREGPTKDQTQK